MSKQAISQDTIRSISYNIINAAIEVHRQLGPGLLESIYEECLEFELKSKFDYEIVRQQLVPVYYKGNELGKSLRLDMLVENLIIVEVKATKAAHETHQAQLLSYMRLANKPKGILINFNAKLVAKAAIHLVNDIFANLPPN